MCPLEKLNFYSNRIISSKDQNQPKRHPFRCPKPGYWKTKMGVLTVASTIRPKSVVSNLGPEAAKLLDILKLPVFWNKQKPQAGIESTMSSGHGQPENPLPLWRQPVVKINDLDHLVPLGQGFDATVKARVTWSVGYLSWVSKLEISIPLYHDVQEEIVGNQMNLVWRE